MTLIICLLGILSSFFDISLPAINGKDIRLSDFKGRKILLVNTASQNVLANQVIEFQNLQDKYKDRLFVILVPSNNTSFTKKLVTKPLDKEYKKYLSKSSGFDSSQIQNFFFQMYSYSAGGEFK